MADDDRQPQEPAVQMRRVAIAAKASSAEAQRTAIEISGWLERRGVTAFLDEATARAGGLEGAATFSFHEPYDLLVVLGGDGTLLSVARNLERESPILGVNLGRLGFLTEIGRNELYPALVQILAGRFRAEKRRLFEVEHRTAGGALRRYRVLNDAVIAKSALARIIELTLRIDDRFVAQYRADGLILSSPTGSTAYNLSAAGPIVNPELPVVVLTPICPHTLTLRPLVAPDASLIEVTLDTRREEVYLTLDGQEGAAMTYGDTVRVARSAATASLVRISGRSFYDNLRAKLHWGE
jgi:NAD+ kinase